MLGCLWAQGQAALSGWTREESSGWLSGVPPTNTPPPLPFTLHPSRTRSALLLLCCLLLVAAGVAMVRHGDAAGYFIGGLFALGIPFLALQFNPRASFLRLEETGFTYCSLFRAYTVPWTRVNQFGVISIGRHRLVAWNFVPGLPTTGRGRVFSQAVNGYEAGLPSTYGRKPAELAELMNALCQRHGGSGQTASGS